MKTPAIAAIMLVMMAPLALGQNITTAEDCVKALEDAQVKITALGRIYYLFSILFALLLMTIAFSALYIVRARRRLRRLEEIEAYEEIKKAERKERAYRPKEEKKGFFSRLLRGTKGAAAKKTARARVPAKRRTAKKPLKSKMYRGPERWPKTR
ncbi:MAG: hypothetical protein QXU82_01780 [Candidatus Aenigmatarchaeota archaeon]